MSFTFSTNDIINPFWGPVTSTIDWCEPNYSLTRYIAEPANTISNLSFVILGILGAVFEYIDGSDIFYRVLFLSISAIGCGSILFHGTLTIWGQLADELQMVWFLLIFFQFVNRSSDSGFDLQTSAPLTLYGLLFSIWHLIFKTTTAFQIHFGALAFLLMARIYQKYKKCAFDQKNVFLLLHFIASLALGFSFWLFDYHFCEFSNNLPFKFNGHVLWHVFMAYAAYCSVVLLKILQCSQDHKPVVLRTKMFLPVVSIIKSHPSESCLVDNDAIEIKPIF